VSVDRETPRVSVCPKTSDSGPTLISFKVARFVEEIRGSVRRVFGPARAAGSTEESSDHRQHDMSIGVRRNEVVFQETRQEKRTDFRVRSAGGSSRSRPTSSRYSIAD
jgi:hypothetical protein